MRSITEKSSEDENSLEERHSPMQAKKLPKSPNLQTDYDKMIANSRAYLSSIAYKFAEVATNIMSTSKGRNKLCSLIQYQAKLIYTCTINSNIPDVQNMLMHLGNKPSKVLLSGRIYSTMSKHRKIFNLFKFIDEVTAMSKILNNNKIPGYLKVLDFSGHLGSFFYFVFDNFLWLCYSNIINFIPDQKLAYFKYVKDLGSFSRICFNLVTNILYLKQHRKANRELKESLIFMGEEPIKPGSEEHKKLKELLDARFEYRNATIEVIHSVVIIIMLWKSLGFLGHEKINPVMGASIDYLATILGLFKTLFDSPQLMITTIEQQTTEKSEKGDLIRSLSSVFNINAAPFQPPNLFVEPETPPKFRTFVKTLVGPKKTSLRMIGKEGDSSKNNPETRRSAY